MGMTIKKRLARSNIAMLVIPILAAAVLLLLGLGAALLLLRGNLLTLRDAVEQIEHVLHGFKLTLCAYAAAAVLLLLGTVALTNLYLTRSLFRHISQPLDTLTAGPLAADTACRRVTKNGTEIPLKNKEYELLLFLMRHPGQVFSREDLYEMIWGLESLGDNITVAVHMNRLREKLEDDPAHPQLLQTVWGVGYRLSV